MVLGYESIVYGTQVLHVETLTRKKIPGTIKQKLGGNLVRYNVPTRDSREWEIQISGIMFDTSTTATTSRKVLEDYDDLEKRQYSDGLVTGSFIITNLQFNDSGESPLSFRYSMTLTEYDQ